MHSFRRRATNDGSPPFPINGGAVRFCRLGGQYLLDHWIRLCYFITIFNSGFGASSFSSSDTRASSMGSAHPRCEERRPTATQLHSVSVLARRSQRQGFLFICLLSVSFVPVGASFGASCAEHSARAVYKPHGLILCCSRRLPSRPLKGSDESDIGQGACELRSRIYSSPCRRSEL